MTEFKNLIFKKALPDESLFVPFFRWISGYEDNIELCQSLNLKFYKCNMSILNKEMYLKNKLKKFIKVPKDYKTDKDMDFFYTDVAKQFGWTKRELFKNMCVIDINSLKEEIATNFGYDNTERKQLKLTKLRLK